MKLSHIKSIQWGVFFIISIALVTTLSFAQGKYPTKPVSLVVGYAPGGLNDIQVRSMAPQLSKELDQNVIVINKPGAGTTLAINYIANAKPDGYTIGYAGHSGMFVVPFMEKLPYHPLKDLKPIMQFAGFNFGVFVKADLKSVTEAAAGAASKIPDDFRVSITNTPGKGAYPISSFTWLLKSFMILSGMISPIDTLKKQKIKMIKRQKKLSFTFWSIH